MNHYERRSSADPENIGIEEVFVESEPLLQASRNFRLAAASQLPALLEVIARTAKEKLAAVRKVTDKQ